MTTDKVEAVKAKRNPLINYFQASFEELRKVTWPTRNQAIRLTFLVLGFSISIAVLLGILDFVFGTSYRALLDLGPDISLPVLEEAPATTGDVPTIEVSGVTAEVDGGDGVTIDVGGEESAVVVDAEAVDVGTPTAEGESALVEGEAVPTESTEAESAAETPSEADTSSETLTE